MRLGSGNKVLVSPFISLGNSLVLFSPPFLVHEQSRAKQQAATHTKRIQKRKKKKKRRPKSLRHSLIGTSSDRVIGPRRVRARQNRERPRCRDQPRRGQNGASLFSFFLLLSFSSGLCYSPSTLFREHFYRPYSAH